MESNVLRNTGSGAVVGARDPEGGLVWLGIRYGAAPVGAQRWRRPAPAPSWTGVFEALHPGSPATQFDETGAVIGAEDCLHLNIWAPEAASHRGEASGDRLPVMVWIHGGGNVMGRGDQYNGARLATGQNVVVVTFNYRLGFFGWFSHASLREGADSAEERSGNFGTLDILLALRWVRDNIAAFGGDPENVTIFGQSAGGCNVLSMMTSPLAKGLFHRAIIQSGYAFTPSVARASNPTDAAEPGTAKSGAEIGYRLLMAHGGAASRAEAKAIAAKMGGEAMAAFLRERSLSQFAAAAADIPDTDLAMLSPGGVPQLFGDGVVLPSEPPLAVVRAGRHNKTPLMIGATRDELTILMALYAPSPFMDVGPDGAVRIPDRLRFQLAADYASALWRADQVDTMASAFSDGQAEPVYVYRFDWSELAPAPWWDDLDLGATHGLDVPFVFGHLRLGPEFLQLPLIRPQSMERFAALSDAMMSYWGSFARNGDPGRGDGERPAWRPWSNGEHLHHLDWPLPPASSPGVVTRARVLNEIHEDARLGNPQARAQFLSDLVSIRGAGFAARPA